MSMTLGRKVAKQEFHMETTGGYTKAGCTKGGYTKGGYTKGHRRAPPTPVLALH